MKVLIVEDDQSIRDALEECFGFFNPRAIMKCDSAESALKVIDSFKPDLILTDYRMTGMDGIDFVKELRIRLCRAYVVMLTGMPSPEVTSAVLLAGAHDILAKPFNIKDIEIIFGKALLEKTKPIRSLEVVELDTIRAAIARTKSLQAAADALGIDQATLWRKRKNAKSVLKKAA